TLWLTTLFAATKVPWAPVASRTATLRRCTRSKSGPTRPAGRSGSDTTWSRGTTSTCPGNSGRTSRKATATASSSTTWAGRSPATMRQNVQSTGSTAPTVPPRPRSGGGPLAARHPDDGHERDEGQPGQRDHGEAGADARRVGDEADERGHHEEAEPRRPRHHG